ncbi:arginine--tRNA ligase [Paenibacillus sp. P96]|uniref:Arginine--tRNA ligase n=1 Tax=Paenibacillus zeirhizosphaerae TaxID=2987519 RepID=A0ABT9FRS6_9BACL|nr:arginine--tRNA ligase [Paenibacillus sp. P96]MDP4097444.1 arginine--tRNA ligase [Paenibacillus sp. P96]
MIMNIAAQVLSGPTGLSENELLQLLEQPPNPEWGDAALPCFVLAKARRISPQNIAASLAETLGQEQGICAEAAGPYVNLKLDPAVFASVLLEKIGAADFGRLDLGQGQRVVIDMSSPNIAKPFGIGHLRSTVIGAALYRLLAEAGYETVSVNHLGDWGTQFGKQITAYKRWGNDETLARDPIGESLKLYVRFHDEMEQDASLETEARDWFRRLEEGDPEAQRLWRYFVDISLQEFDRMYKRLGVTFDHVLGESFYNDKMKPVVEELRNQGLLEESEGAMVVRLDEQDLPPCLILKTDGTTIYPTRDLATAIYRREKMRAERLLYVVGAEQKLHFRQVFAVLDKMGADWATQCEHIPFGLMRFEGKKMSTRRGKVVMLNEVLDEAVSRAMSVMQEKNPDLPDKQTVAEQVGIGAVIFGDLKNNRINEVDFSLEDVLRFDGETGPYVQYTHARINSALNKLKNHEAVTVADLNTGLLGDAGWSLLQQLSRYPEALERSVKRLEPSVMARFALDTAQSFNRFYHHERIENGGPWRLRLTELTAELLARSLHLLGLHAPHQM